MTGLRGIALVIPIACCSGVFARQANGPAFDVASIWNSTGDGPHPQFPFDGGGFPMNAFLVNFIESAYDVEFYQVIGGPSWIHTDRYDVQAKTAVVSKTRQVREMLQNLLADRFQLKAHRETRMLAGYALDAA
jgi:uncharacterized protein (TIGR03435 family)